EQKQKIEIAKADKERTVLEAEAQAEQMTRIADAKAKEIEVIAQAEAQAHMIIAEAVTPESLRHRTIERWDGILPKVVGGSSGLLLQLGLEEEPKSDKR
ncbi:MAG: prohibitin family protein, partial [Planctomycetes bacterium]|nr:prohibitin family protein [Planctomycetota bacterium]